jgi:hypothetical protein
MPPINDPEGYICSVSIVSGPSFASWIVAGILMIAPEGA